MRRAVPFDRAHSLVARALQGAARLEVATDFDGTLVGIVARPSGAVPPARVRRAIARLVELHGVRVAVLSGRPLADLERRLKVPGVFLAGAAGLEVQPPGGRRRRTTGRAVPRALAEALRAWCDRYPGAWVESKGPALAVHFRALSPRRRGPFGAGVRRRVAAHRRRVVLERGKMVYELRPRGAGTKAGALDRWRGRTRATARRARIPLFYFGDDANDEPVFERVRRLGGFSIAVGRRTGAAEYHLRGPDEVLAVLDWLAAAWQARRGRGGRG